MDPGDTFRSLKLAAPWVLAAGMALGATALVARTIPPNTFNPLCTYDLTYRLNATIEVGGRQYTSQVVVQGAHSRDWIARINTAGCRSTYGTALPFRLADDRVVLLRPHLCRAARRALAGTEKDYEAGNFRRAMAERRTVEVTRLCNGIGHDWRSRIRVAEGYLIDNAERPRHWRGFGFGHPLPPSDEIIRLVRASAQAADIWPSDPLAEVAPGVLKTHFRYTDWLDSPEAILSSSRRRSLFRQTGYVAEPF
jgi:hypothetical protein